MSLKDKEKWNEKYRARQAEDRQACDWLLENAHLLSGEGQALDLAMGEGRNALYLAERGYQVTGVDISDVGVARAAALAQENNLNLRTVVADLDNYAIKENEYDLISCFYFLDRRLFPAIGRHGAARIAAAVEKCHRISATGSVGVRRPALPDLPGRR